MKGHPEMRHGRGPLTGSNNLGGIAFTCGHETLHEDPARTVGVTDRPDFFPHLVSAGGVKLISGPELDMDVIAAKFDLKTLCHLLKDNVTVFSPFHANP
jgi:hypothetical protein